MHDFELGEKPRFGADPEGGTVTATLRVKTYITLLVRANITEPGFWPPGMEQGAEALARVRQIESDCIAKVGEFDWEKLPPDVQDEYDLLCISLDRLGEDGDPVDWETYKSQAEESRP